MEKTTITEMESDWNCVGLIPEYQPPRRERVGGYKYYIVPCYTQHEESSIREGRGTDLEYHIHLDARDGGAPDCVGIYASFREASEQIDYYFLSIWDKYKWPWEPKL